MELIKRIIDFISSNYKSVAITLFASMIVTGSNILAGIFLFIVIVHTLKEGSIV